MKGVDTMAFIESARIAERIWIRENSAAAMKNA